MRKFIKGHGKKRISFVLAAAMLAAMLPINMFQANEPAAVAKASAAQGTSVIAETEEPEIVTGSGLVVSDAAGKVQLSTTNSVSTDYYPYVMTESVYGEEHFEFTVELEEGAAPNLIIGARINDPASYMYSMGGNKNGVVIRLFDFYFNVKAPGYWGTAVSNAAHYVDADTKLGGICKFGVDIKKEDSKDILYFTVTKNGEQICSKSFDVTGNVPDTGNFVIWSTQQESPVIDYCIGQPAADKEQEGTTVLDFNGTDFGTAIKGTGSIKSASATSLQEDTSGIPTGFSGSVYAGGDASYAAVGVDCDLPIDLSQITSVKVRMYVPEYNTTGTPQLRIMSTDETTNGSNWVGGSYTDAWGGSFGTWCEIDITSALKSNSITKDANGYLDRFVVALRTYADSGSVPTVCFDSIIIEHTGSIFVEEEEVVSDYKITLTSLKSVTYREDGCWVIYMNYAGTLPTDATYDVSLSLDDGKRIISEHLWRQSDSVCYIGLWAHPDTNLIFRSGLLPSDNTEAASVALANDFKLSCIDGKITPYLPEVSSWTKITAAKGFGTAPVTLTGNISSAFDTLENTELSFNGYFLNEEDSTSTALLFLGTGSTGWMQGIRIAIYNDKKMGATDYMSGENPVTLYNLLTGSPYIYLSQVDSEYTNTDPAGFKFRTQFVDGHVYISVYLNNTLAGIYCAENCADKYGKYIFGYSEGDGGTYHVETYSSNKYADITLMKLGTASGVSGSTWGIYPISSNASATPGTPWSTKFLNVAYEIDGKGYTANFTRANNSEGLYFTIPGSQLEPDADGVTITIKAGKYASNDGSDGLNITEDFTFYAIKGALTTEFNFDDPDFTSTVYCNVDTDTYTVTDAETVTIDGTAYNYGDAYAVIGTHTLTYSMYNREYSRKLVLYRAGEVGDTDKVDIYDLVRMKKALAGDTVLTESGAMGADMNNSGAVDMNDVSLLRKYLVMSSGVLILCPADNAAAGEPSEAVAALTANYDPAACKSAGLKNGEDIYFRNTLTVNWISFENVSEYQVLLATDADLNGAMTYTTTVPSLSLMNLLPDTTYYWAVRAGDYTIATRSFTTADTVRTLTVEGVSNTRDIGGYAAADGKRVRYGMVYRGGKLNDITEKGLYQMMTVLGTKTDLDLRTPGEGGAGGGSPLGSSVNYYNYNAPYYWNTTSGLLAESYKEALISEIRTFADQDNYPIYVHCSIGRDRTGTILFLISGLLGVSKEDLYLDYELSFLSASGGSDSADVSVMINYVDAMYDGIRPYAPEGTFADACEAFILSLGITRTEIDTIRELLLEK